MRGLYMKVSAETEQPFGPQESSFGFLPASFLEASMQASTEVSELPQPLQSRAPLLAKRYTSPILSPHPETRPTVRRRADPMGPMGARAGALSADLARAAPSEALGRARLAPPVAVASNKGACLTSVARVVATPWVGSGPSCRRPSRCVHELPFSLSVQSAAMPTKRKPRASMPSACSPPSTAHAMAHALKHEAFRATCSEKRQGWR